MKYPKHNVIAKYNTILSNNNQELRLIEVTPDGLLLSTGVLLKNTKEIHNFYKHCKSLSIVTHIDYLYEDFVTMSDKMKSLRKKASSVGGKKAQQKHGEKIKNNLNTGEPWNKGLTKDIDSRITSSWISGLTKDTSAIVHRMATNKIGDKNPMYGAKLSDERKNNLSIGMKNKIKCGEFTPNIHNSKTHWQAVFSGRKYRSSWEAVFHHLNMECEYEKIRLTYIINGVEKVYITDFVDEKSRILYEIKPSSYSNDIVVMAKQEAAMSYCSKNNYQYIIVDESYFYDQFFNIDFSLFDDNVISKMRKLYEAEESKRNKKA